MFIMGFYYVIDHQPLLGVFAGRHVRKIHNPHFCKHKKQHCVTNGHGAGVLTLFL